MKYLNLSRTRFVPTRRTKLKFHVLAYKSNSDRLTKTRGLNFFPILLFLAVLCLATAGPAAAQDGVFQYKEIYNQKPPFYKGSNPLTVISGKKFISQSEKITVFQNFGEFENVFQYNDPAMKYSGIADKAVAKNTSGSIIAVAQLKDLLQGEGILINEEHVDKNGTIIFKCTSFIEFGTGFKIKETNVKGEKQRDFFFIWPVKPF